MTAIATFILEDGICTRVCRAIMPLRMRVSISAIGSVMFIAQTLLAALPARLRHARQLATERQLAEADAANAELAHVGAGPAADVAAVVLLHAKLGLALGFDNHRDLRHRCPLQGERPGFGGVPRLSGFRSLSPVLAGDIRHCPAQTPGVTPARCGWSRAARFNDMILLGGCPDAPTLGVA